MGEQRQAAGFGFHERLSWRCHVDHTLAQGERKLHACLSWTCLYFENISLTCTEPIFNAYARPSACFGCQLKADAPKLLRINTRFSKGPDACHHGPAVPPPTLVVQGQPGWLNIESCRLVIGAGPWARQLSFPGVVLPATMQK